MTDAISIIKKTHQPNPIPSQLELVQNVGHPKEIKNEASTSTKLPSALY